MMEIGFVSDFTMPDPVVPFDDHVVQVAIEKAIEVANRYGEKCHSPNTWRAYRMDWRTFDDWCRSMNLDSLPASPETIEMFVASEADKGLSPSTIRRRLAAIQLVHFGFGHAPPHKAWQVTKVVGGAEQEWANPVDKKAPTLLADILRMADAADLGTNKGFRDRALLLFGFAGAFRRSELVGLDVEDLDVSDQGVIVNIRKSKTDQDATGQSIAIPKHADSRYCPVVALKAWQKSAEITRGALFRRMFRSDIVGSKRLGAQSIALIVKDYAARVGLNGRRLSSRSLRSGFLTSAAQNGADILKVAEHSRHKSLQTLMEYFQDGQKLDGHPGQDLL